MDALVVPEETPAATTPFGRLKLIIVRLQGYAEKDSKTATTLINELVTECEKSGMEISPQQKAEAGLK